MHSIKLEPAFADQRGEIFDLVEEQIDSISRITFQPNSIRGNHVHFETTQWTFVTEGSLEVFTVTDGITNSRLFSKGDFFVSKPGEPHAMKSVGIAEILVFTQGPRSGKNYQSDTFPIKIVE